MLDTATKSRIDSARDILVGKVPDPKSQVEQITIALIYKFMDDMDRQSEELGGKAAFFTGEFKKYRWSNLLDNRFGGHERLLLYAESIERMSENKNIPQLFRDIFKGVFLPYRDPETLNLFLKEINGFTYDHSERLGDAYEYLLSVLGTQGNAGQFRTPRHIIDFIVEVVAPQKHETILDPACGTAGFLISAYKHILAAHSSDPSNPSDKSDCHRPLTPAERAQLMKNFCGYDIAPDMVRLSRVNLYLHGFPNPTIHEYDTLTSEERWDERYDVIMANPPFMSPKGGIRPHNRFSIKANRSEVLFVDYIAEHLNPGGRAGIIVPEGIIFQGQNAYKALRKMLVENYLWAVVSLPAGVFNPYSGVKTSILFLDRALAKRADSVLFVKIENDGFDLGAQRRPIPQNDLPAALRALQDWKTSPRPTGPTRPTGQTHAVPRQRLLESPDLSLSGDRYRPVEVRGPGKWPMVKLGEVCELIGGGTPSKAEKRYWTGGSVKWISAKHIDEDGNLVGWELITREAVKDSATNIVPANSVVLVSRVSVGKMTLLKEPVAVNQDLTGFLIRDPSRLIPPFLFGVLKGCVNRIVSAAQGLGVKGVTRQFLADLELPLPPMAEQERLVAEWEGYRQVIAAARQILAHYKPTLRLDPKWPLKPLAEIASLEYGLTATGRETGDARLIRITDITNEGTLSEASPKFVKLDAEARAYLLKQDDILVARTGATYGKTLLFHSKAPAVFASYLIRLRFDSGILPRFYWLFSQSENYWRQARALVTGGGQPQFNGNALKEIVVPAPPLAVQREIVAEMEAERELVEANRELAARFEQKLQASIAAVWGAPSESSESSDSSAPCPAPTIN